MAGSITIVSEDNEQVFVSGGHFAVGDFMWVHREESELYRVAPEGVIDAGKSNEDIIIENPSGSGNLIDIIDLTISATVGYETAWHYNATYPTGGTAIEPFNLNDRSATPDMNVRHGTNIVDETTADRQVPGGIAGGGKKNTCLCVENQHYRPQPRGDDDKPNVDDRQWRTTRADDVRRRV